MCTLAVLDVRLCTVHSCAEARVYTAVRVRVLLYFKCVRAPYNRYFHVRIVTSVIKSIRANSRALIKCVQRRALTYSKRSLITVTVLN